MRHQRLTGGDRKTHHGRPAGATLVTDVLHSAVDSLRDELIDTRRTLHRNPELGFQEHQTAELIAQRCQTLGYKVRTGIGKTGVLADFDSGRPGPLVMLRADMDALPVKERHAFAWCSRNDAMHACGHDGHVAIQLGVASILKQRSDWNGQVRLCFQPAEEIAGGAEPMIADGALEGVDRVLGLHLFAPLDAGRVAVREGAVFGSADAFTVRVTGEAGHGGMPHLSVDPIMVTAQIISGLQSIISRETSPFSPGVISIGQIHGGSAFNVIADQTWFQGTVRAFSVEEQQRILRRIEEVAKGIAAAHRASAAFELDFTTPPVVSSKESAELVRRAAVESLGEDKVDVAEPVTAGDDVAYFLNQVPGCYFLVGAGYPGKDNAPHHHPEFDIDEACLTVGTETLARAALAALQ